MVPADQLLPSDRALSPVDVFAGWLGVYLDGMSTWPPMTRPQLSRRVCYGNGSCRDCTAWGGVPAREKVHTDEAVAIAASGRRLPMVEAEVVVDAHLTLTGPDAPITRIDARGGRGHGL